MARSIKPEPKTTLPMHQHSGAGESMLDSDNTLGDAMQDVQSSEDPNSSSGSAESAQKSHGGSLSP